MCMCSNLFFFPVYHRSHSRSIPATDCIIWAQLLCHRFIPKNMIVILMRAVNSIHTHNIPQSDRASTTTTTTDLSITLTFSPLPPRQIIILSWVIMYLHLFCTVSWWCCTSFMLMKVLSPWLAINNLLLNIVFSNTLEDFYKHLLNMNLCKKRSTAWLCFRVQYCTCMFIKVQMN